MVTPAPKVVVCAMRSGFTLIETLVALVLFQFGMLAVAATSAVAARDLAVAQRIARAQSLARHRVELLRAMACSATGADSVTAANGLREFWHVESLGPRRLITDSVDFALPRGRRGHVVMRASALCAP